MKKIVSIIGMGMVGSGWSIGFARAGCVSYGPMYHRLVHSRRHPAVWSNAVLDEVEKQRLERLPETDLKQRQLWRDQCLMALRQHQSDVS